MKLASTNYAAAKEKFETAAFVAGEGSIVAHRIRTGQLQQALKDMENVDKVWDEFNNKKSAAVSALAQQRLQREDSERQAKARIEAARIRAKATEDKKGASGFLKPGAQVTANYLGQNALLADMQDITNDLKNPKIRKLITEKRLEAFASEGFGTVMAQLAMDEIPSELRQFLTKVRNVRNNYYLTISGKAVTGGEAMRNYNVVPAAGDSPDVLGDKAEAMTKQVARTISQYQKLYGLPPLDSEAINTFRTSGENSNFDVRSLPVQDDSVSAIPKVGEIRSGYRFKGGNPADQSNWEQVQ
jgi:hypothetical protein